MHFLENVQPTMKKKTKMEDMKESKKEYNNKLGGQ